MGRGLGSDRWVVLKFGGTSISSLACWETVAKVIQERQAGGLRPVVICSAISGISIELEKLLNDARAGSPEQALGRIEV